MDKVRFGIIGMGNIGTTHAENLVGGQCGDGALTAFCDINAAKLEAAKGRFPGVPAYGSAAELMDSGAADAVIIAVPHYDHPGLSMAAFAKGLHVVCEKPAGVYTKQVRAMNEAADKAGVVFGMMFNQRTNCLYRKMREIVQSGELGAIKRTNWIITDWYRSQAYYNSGGWRATWQGEGGGVLINQCPHNLDLWQWICGMPRRVRAFAAEGKWHDIEVEDDVTAYVEYDNGATGVLVTTTGDYPGTNRFEISGDNGKLVCERGKLMFFRSRVPEREFNRTNTIDHGTPGFDAVEIETDGQNRQHAGVLAAFAGAVLRGEPLVARGQEGINSLTLSNAMNLSAWLDKTVELPFDEDLYYNLLQKRIASSQAK